MFDHIMYQIPTAGAKIVHPIGRFIMIHFQNAFTFEDVELDGEGVEVGGALGHDVAHQIDSSARKIVKLLGAGEWVCR